MPDTEARWLGLRARDFRRRVQANPFQGRAAAAGWIAGAMAAAIFVLDLRAPVGHAVPTLYLLPILLTWFVPGRRTTVLMIAVGLCLTWLKSLYVPGELTLAVGENGAVTSVLILVVGILLVRQKRLAEEAEAVRQGEAARQAADIAVLARLSEASERLWRTGSLQEGLDQMLGAAIGLLEANMGQIQFLDGARSALVVAAHRGCDQALLDFLRAVSCADDTPCARALRSGQRILIEDVETDAASAPLRDIARAVGFRAVQSTPLIGRDGTALGMLSTYFRSPHRLAEARLRHLDLYVHQLVTFIERCRAEERLLRSEAKLRAVFDSLTEGVVFLNAEGVVEEANDAVRGLHVHPLEELRDPVLDPRRRMICGDGTPFPLVEQPAAVALRTGQAVRDVEMGLPLDDGTVRWRLVNARPVHDERGNRLGAVASYFDITERKQAEEASRDSRAKLEAALASMTDAVFISDAQGRFVEFNEAFATFYRFKGKEDCARTLAEYPDIIDVFLPDGTPASLDMWATPRALRGETATSAEYTLRRKDTGETWVASYSFGPIRDREGVIVGCVVTGRDITRRKRSEEALRASQERLALAASGTRIGMFEWDLVTGRALWTEQFSRLMGLPATPTASATGVETTLSQEHSYRLWADCVHPEDLPRLEAELRRCRDEHVPYEAEYRVVWPDQSAHWVAARGLFHYGAQGEPVRMLGILMDISEHKQAEALMAARNEMLEQAVAERTALLAAANERLDWAMRGTHDGLWDWDIAGGTVYFSPRWREMHGFGETDECPLAEKWASRIHPEDRDRLTERLEAYLDHPEPEFWEEYRVRRKDGTLMWVLDRGVALRDGNGRATRMVGAETDITWRREAEAALRRSEREFRALADNVPGYFGYIDPRRRFTFVNARFEDLFGRRDEEIAGTPVAELLGAEAYAQMSPHLDAALAGRPVSVEQQLAIAAVSGHWFAAHYVPDRNPEGRVEGVFALFADVTTLKEVEAALRGSEAQLHDLSARLLQAQDEERRRIARDLHDDFTQRLAGLAIGLERMSRGKSGADGSSPAAIVPLIQEAQRLTGDLQHLAHTLHPSILEHAGLEAALRELAEECARNTGLSVKTQFRSVPVDIPLDRATCLYRVSQESLHNVGKHAGASRVTLRLVGTRGGVGICVQDDGCGIDRGQFAAQVPGMGLTSMTERVSMLRGTLRVKARTGSGTEVHAWLPLADGGADA